MRVTPDKDFHGEPDPAFRARLLELVPHLRVFARILHAGRAGADDLVADSLCEMIERYEPQAPETDLRPLLFPIMYRRALSAHRATSPPEAAPPADVTGTSRIEWQLRNLSIGERAALYLAVLENLPHESCARTLNIGIPAFRSRLSSAWRKLYRQGGTDPQTRPEPPAARLPFD